MSYSAIGTAANETSNEGGQTGPGTISGLAGNEQHFHRIWSRSPRQLGNDSICLKAGNTGVADGGSENDLIFGSAVGAMQLFGGNGADTITVITSSNLTTLGGNDSADGADLITAGSGADIIFGHGGNDTINPGDGGDNTVVCGFGDDSVLSPGATSDDLVLGQSGQRYGHRVAWQRYGYRRSRQ